MSKSRRGNEPKGDARYHDTWLLLRKYRDVVWSMEVSVAQSKKTFRQEFGMSIEEYLDSMYSAGVDINDEKLADHARSLKKSYDMLQLLDSAIDVMRRKHRYGEEYYWILYYTFLSPQELTTVEDIVDVLTPHITDISRATYYRKRQDAIQALSSLLWGFADKDTLGLMESFVGY